MHAIETRYKGYRFRSRLEARWAVFFDALGYHWDYEREGFDLDGVWYLPDFWLEDIGRFAEVKPRLFTPQEFLKSSACGCLLLDGPPEVRWYWDAGFTTPGWSPTHANYRQAHTSCQPWGMIHLDYSLYKKRPWHSFGEDMTTYDNSDFERAVFAARAARFEHAR